MAKIAIMIPIRSKVRQVPDHFGEWQVNVWYREDRIIHACKKRGKIDISNSVFTKQNWAHQKPKLENTL